MYNTRLVHQIIEYQQSTIRNINENSQLLDDKIMGDLFFEFLLSIKYG